MGSSACRKRALGALFPSAADVRPLAVTCGAAVPHLRLVPLYVGAHPTGADAGGLARYLHGPGTHTVHEYRNDRGALIVGGKVIAGTVPVRHEGDGAGWARQFTHAGKARPKVVRNVWHCSLRCAPTDRTLSDREWSGIGQHLADRMGYGQHPWVMVRHDTDHVHIAVSRVGFDGTVWKGSNDRHIAVATMREDRKSVV